jgi:hypothetical protein
VSRPVRVRVLGQIVTGTGENASTATTELGGGTFDADTTTARTVYRGLAHLLRDIADELEAR